MKISISSCLLPHHHKGRFYNHIDDKPENVFLHTLPSFLSSLRNRSERLPEAPQEWVIKPQFLPTSQTPIITWLGHASFLIQIEQVTILTDPIFGPLSWFFPRMLPSVLTAADLPPIDIVLLSHNHPDHTDIKSLKQLPADENRWFGVPQGDKAWLEKKGFSRVEEFMWWQQMKVDTPHGSVTVTFLPAHHWSARGLFDKNRSLWGSWMIQAGGYTIYFGGDTAYWRHFQAIGDEFKSVSAALLPIGPCEPEEWMQRTHMNPENAIIAGAELKAQRIVPMHWGSFPFGRDHFEGPLKRLNAAWQTNALADVQLDLIKTGQSILL